MSQLNYNGIDLSYIKTESFSHENAFDPSGIDRLYTRFRISVTSVLATGMEPALVDPKFDAETPGEKMARIEHMLMSKQKRLVYIAGGGIQIDTAKDDNNGPTPISCLVTSITDGAFLIQFVIEACLTNCGIPPEILSVKWATTVSYDENWCETRTVAGLAITSSRMGEGFDFDSLRSKILPKCPPGYRRDNLEFRRSEDGLRLSSSCRDKQLHRIPPAPATSIGGWEYLDSKSPGGIVMQMLDMTLTAPPGTSIPQLHAAAMKIVGDRVEQTGYNIGDNAFLMNLKLGKGLSDKETVFQVAASWQMQVAVKKSGKYSMKKAVESWLQAGLPGEDASRAIEPPVMGVGAELRLLAVGLLDPCGVNYTQPPEEGTRVIQGTLKEGGGTATLNIGPPLQLFGIDVSPSGGLLANEQESVLEVDNPGVYLSFKCVAHHTRNEGISVNPPTGTSSVGHVCKMHGPTHKVIVEYDAKRAGGPPEIPDPQPQDSNLVLLKSTISTSNDDVGADGKTIVHTVTGVYHYQYIDASKSSIAAPIPPFFKTAAGQRAGKAISLLSQNIVNNPGDQNEKENPWV